MPSRFKEVRIAKRVLLTIYIVFTFGLCIATAVSIVRTLAREAPPPVAEVPSGPDAQALVQLRRLLQELRQQFNIVGRANPQKVVQLSEWGRWKQRWQADLQGLAQRYGLDAGQLRPTEAGRALQQAYRGLLPLLARYEQAISNLAEARRMGTMEVDADLARAAKALRAKKP